MEPSLCQRREFLTVATISGLLYVTGREVSADNYRRGGRIFQRRTRNYPGHTNIQSVAIDRGIPIPKPIDDSPESRKADEYTREKYKNYGLTQKEKEKLAQTYGHGMVKLLADIFREFFKK